MGMPVKRINPGDKKWQKFDMIEDVFNDLEAKIDAAKKAGVPCLYVLDSLDALSDKAEMKRKIDEQDFPRKPANSVACSRFFVSIKSVSGAMPP